MSENIKPNLVRLVVAVSMCGVASPAYCHAFAQRYDLPIPLGLYVAGAGAAVALSFVAIAFVLRGASGLRSYPRINLLNWRIGRALSHPYTLFVCRVLSVAIFVLIILAGFIGHQNPFKNIAPTTVWVIWWVGLAYVSALVGNLWALINPWKIIFAWAETLYARLEAGQQLSRRLPYPSWLGVWPAVVLFLTFTWMEMVWHANDVPANLAYIVVIYSVITWSGMALFGSDVWLRQGEPFSLAFGLLARFSPTEVRVTSLTVCRSCSSSACQQGGDDCINCYECFRQATAAEREWNVRPYAVGLLTHSPVHWSMMVFVLLILSTVTFDGFRETPLWVTLAESFYQVESLRPLLLALHEIGTNIPMLIDTLALISFPILFLVCYLIFSRLMALATGGNQNLDVLARFFVLTLIPIAIAYHLAHYLSYLLMVGQYMIPLVSDPFGFGWDLVGTRLYFIRISIVDARFVWYTAVIAIVVGHIAAVYLAHVLALRVFQEKGLALRSQVPMLVLMVGYTMISLWILAQPIVER